MGQNNSNKSANRGHLCNWENFSS